MISVTKLLKKYFEPFDSLKVATDLVKNHPKYSKHTVESLLKEWDDKRLWGIMMHDSIQAYLEKRASFLEKYKYVENFLQTILSEYDFIKAEYKIRHEKYGIVGVIDAIFIHKITDELLIIDWKTNTTIRKYNKYANCKAPLEHLGDCNWNEYSLQLNLYKALLQDEVYVGDCRLVICHIQKTQVKTLEVGDMEKEIGYILYELGTL